MTFVFVFFFLLWLMFMGKIPKQKMFTYYGHVNVEYSNNVAVDVGEDDNNVVNCF